MMTYDYRKRPSAEECLLHPWIRTAAEAASNNHRISSKAIQSLRNFRADFKLQQAVLSYVSLNLLTNE
jgi:hypothetical protein